jgi:hypothetical protein
MNAPSSMPHCPRCGRADQVCSFGDLYTFELNTSRARRGCNPFSIFTSSGNYGTNNSDAEVDLAGGCLVGLIGLITLPLQNWYAKKNAPQKLKRDQQDKAERRRWRETLETWPAIFACGRDRTAFLGSDDRGVPAAALFRMLQQGRDGAAATRVLRGEDNPH